MTGYEYEQACAAYLRRKGFRKVQVTQASRDRGADIIAYRKKEKYAVQCKYYATPVGNKAVQEVYAAATFYGCDKAAVMTNSVFTKGAEELAESLGVELMPGISFDRKRFGSAELLFLLVILSMTGIVYAVWKRPDIPQALSFLRAEGNGTEESAIIISAGLIAFGCLLSLLRHYMPAVLMCILGGCIGILMHGEPGGTATVLLLTGFLSAVLCFLRSLTYEPYRYRKEDASEPAGGVTDAEELPDKGRETGSDDSEDIPEKLIGTEELSVIYDLVNISERFYREAADSEEREELFETISNAYAMLISHEEELPKEWESPSERWEQFRKEEQ